MCFIVCLYWDNRICTRACYLDLHFEGFLDVIVLWFYLLLWYQSCAVLSARVWSLGKFVVLATLVSMLRPWLVCVLCKELRPHFSSDYNLMRKTKSLSFFQFLSAFIIYFFISDNLIEKLSAFCRIGSVRIMVLAS